MLTVSRRRTPVDHGLQTLVLDLWQECMRFGAAGIPYRIQEMRFGQAADYFRKKNSFQR
jgi:hypothetical protein